MNGVDAILGGLRSVTDRISGIFGKWGSSAPLDDKFSGIKMGDKTYNVVVSLNGCYWYIDEDGKKKPIADLPEGSYEWVNIAEKVLKEFKTCYRTLGGKVEVWSWYLINDEMETLREQHRITDSTDLDNPVGTMLEKIPEEWVMIDCDLPDMTERDVTMINRCYKTPGGKVEIEGLEAIDDKLQIRESIYVIVQSTDDNFPAGYEFNLIPADWVRMVCDFPDMTERDVTYANECYETENGEKVNVEGLRAIDNILGVRESIFTVIQTTDPEYPEGTVLPGIPDGWTRIICDFPDMTQRDIVIWNFCYNTGHGKVEVKGYQSVDAVLGVREQYYYIVNSTDPDFPQWKRLDSIPNTWGLTECDFPDMTERHVLKVNECYRTDGGKVRLGGYRSVDGILGVRAEYLYVMETTDPDVQRGTTYTSIPVGWEQMVCDFPDQTTADTEIVENCFQTDGGKIQVRTYLTLDGNGKLRESRHMVLRSTDPDYTTGDELASIPANWLSVECDFASLTQRHIVPLTGCYETGAGQVRVEGYTIVDNMMGVDAVSFTILDSNNPDVAIGTNYTAVPEGWARTECKFAFKGVADTELVENCYNTGAGIVKIRTTIVFDSEGKSRTESNVVIRTSDPAYTVGGELASIPDTFTPVECTLPSNEQRHIIPFDECYTTDGGKVHVKGFRVLDNYMNMDSLKAIVLETTDAAHPANEELTSIPGTWTEIACDFPDPSTADIEVTEDCYETDLGDISVRSVVVYNASGEPRLTKKTITSSSDDNYAVGDDIVDIPVEWEKVECASATSKYMVSVAECYSGTEGKLYVEGWKIVNDKGRVYEMELNVVESTIESIKVGDKLTNLPEDMTVVDCLCNS